MNKQNTEQKFEYLKGDKVLWMVIITISIFSIFPVYSASSNLEYIVNNGTTTGHLIKHMFFVVLGLGLMRAVGFVKYEHIGKLSTILLVISIGLLGVTMFTGQTIDGASASRWLKIPGTPFSFQPSSVAYLALVIYLCRYLTKKIDRERLPIENILYIFGPILVVFILVAKDNGSTALMILMVSIAVLIVGQLNWKYVAGFISTSLIASILFILVALNTNLIGGNRIDTWKSRIETFTTSKTQKHNEVEDESLKAKNYQVMQAKAAIVHGGITGMGPREKRLETDASAIGVRFYFCHYCRGIRLFWSLVSHHIIYDYDYPYCNDCQQDACFFRLFNGISNGYYDFCSIIGKHSGCSQFNSRNRTTFTTDKLWWNIHVGDVSSIRINLKCKFQNTDLRRRRFRKKTKH